LRIKSRKIGTFLLIFFIFSLYMGFLIYNSFHNRRILREIALKDVLITRSLLKSTLREMDTLTPSKIYPLFAEMVDTGNFDYIALLKQDSLIAWYTAYEGFLPFDPQEVDTRLPYVYINTPDYPIIEFHTYIKDGYYLVGGYSLYYIENVWKNSWKNILLTSMVIFVLMAGAFWVYFLMEKKIVNDEIRLKEETARSRYYRELSGLSAQMAHELKNPLNALNMALQLMKQKGARPEYIDIINGEVMKMNSIVERFGTLARSMQAKAEQIITEHLIENVLKQVFRENIDFNVQVLKQIEVSEFSSDYTLLVHALSNIIKNAVEAMRDYKVEMPVIEIKVYKRDGKVCFSVKDNGPGIKDEEKERIFEHFYTTKTYGMGIGLATVKKIATVLGGDVMVFSEENKGTTVELCVKDMKI